jgi:hypothetical protein
MHTSWFDPFGWLHGSASLAARLITLAALAYIVQVCAEIDLRSHSVAETLYAVYPHWGVTFQGWDWIAQRSASTRV